MEIQKCREAHVKVETKFGILFKENRSRNKIITETKTLMSINENKLYFSAE